MYVHTQMHTHMYAGTAHMHTNADTTHIRTCTHTRTRTHIHTSAHTHTQARVHIFTPEAPTCTHTYTHAHVHTRAHVCRTSKAHQLEHDAAVHATLLKHKDEVEKEELRVELALAEGKKQRRLEELHHAALDVTHGIDTFEINMKRLLKGEGTKRLVRALTQR